MLIYTVKKTQFFDAFTEELSMKYLFKIFLVAQLLQGTSLQSQTLSASQIPVETQLKFIEKILEQTGSPEIMNELSANQGRIKELLANPSQVQEELNKSMSEYFDHQQKTLESLEVE